MLGQSMVPGNANAGTVDGTEKAKAGTVDGTLERPWLGQAMVPGNAMAGTMAGTAGSEGIVAAATGIKRKRARVRAAIAGIDAHVIRGASWLTLPAGAVSGDAERKSRNWEMGASGSMLLYPFAGAAVSTAT